MAAEIAMNPVLLAEAAGALPALLATATRKAGREGVKAHFEKAQAAPQPQSKQELRPMNDTAQDRRQATNPAAPPPVLTRVERLAIYRKVRAHWDVTDECYAGSWTDRAIGDALKAPWICVAEIRDGYFGAMTPTR